MILSLKMIFTTRPKCIESEQLSAQKKCNWSKTTSAQSQKYWVFHRE